MKKILLATLFTVISTAANAGLFDSKEQKFVNNVIECSNTVRNTDDMSCASEVMAIVKSENGKMKPGSFTLPKEMTEKQFQGAAMLVAMADMCYKNPKTTEKKTLANITSGDFACGMIQKIKEKK